MQLSGGFVPAAGKEMGRTEAPRDPRFRTNRSPVPVSRNGPAPKDSHCDP